MPPITPAPTDILNDDAENVSAANIGNMIVAHSDSDSEGENIDHDGYELLSQDPEIFLNAENEDEDSNSMSDIEESITAEVNNLNSSSLHVSAPVCSGIESSSHIRNMTEDHIETIKTVMKGITLPSSNLPQWATMVPEEEWKAALLSEMQSKQSQRGCNSREMHMQSSKVNKFDKSYEVLR